MRRISIALPAILCVCVPAYAHTGTGVTHDLRAGFLHPFLGLDHHLVMIAVGVLAALALARAWLAPAGFLAGMTIGALLGSSGVALPLVELSIAACLVVMGLLVLAGGRRPISIVAALAGFTGVPHGFAHMTEAPADGSGLIYFGGFILGTAVLHAAGYLAGKRAAKVSTALPRAAGAATAITGLALLAGAF